MSVDQVRERFHTHFAGADVDPKTAGDRWASLWDVGDFLPFDRGMPNPALEDILSKHQQIIGDCFVDSGSGGERRRKKALVPGCGRGYDVLLLASFGYDAYGLEVSETAVKRCVEEQEKKDPRYNVRNEAAGLGAIHFVKGDFFDKDPDWMKKSKYGFHPGGDSFDLIYDYTTDPNGAKFLSALPPALRPAWSERMAGLLSPRGNLICIEFPTYKDPSSGGPPYGLPSVVYMEHLSHPGEELPYGKDGHVQSNPLKRASPSGLERAAHWQPERTHDIGKGTDWISIWRHR
ncbi:hypothetical protein MMC25_003728 [Agyrium rufum]|nr:hypothetical protein [Agyrium rufum]